MTVDGVPEEGAPLAPPEASTPEPADQPARGSRLHGAWSAWRRWRKTRPFWGGVHLTAGGLWTLGTVKAPLPVILHIGAQGTAAFVVPLLVLLAGLLLLFNPQQRLFYAIIGLIMSLASWVTSNLGGFFVGMLLGIVGGALAFSWAPTKQPPEPRRRRRGSAGPDVDGDAAESEPAEPDAGMDLVTERHQEGPVR